MNEDLKRYTVHLASITPDKEQLVGINARNLSVLHREKLPVENGFVLLSNAFDEMLTKNSLVEPILKELDKVDPKKSSSLTNSSKYIGELIRKSEIPMEILKEVLASYKSLSGFADSVVSIRASYYNDKITSPEQLSNPFEIDNISGEKQLFEAIKQVWSSLFSAEAMNFRFSNDYEGDLSMSVIVSKVLTAESSGKVFNYNPIDNNNAVIQVEARYGMDLETIQPDIYKIDKQNLDIIEKTIAPQNKMFIRTKNFDESFKKEIDISPTWINKQKLDNLTIQNIAKATLIAEQAFEKKKFVLSWTKEADKIYITNIALEDGVVSSSLPQQNFETNDLQSAVEKQLMTVSGIDIQKAEPELKFHDAETGQLKRALSGSGNKKGFAWGAAKFINNREDITSSNPKTIFIVPDRVVVNHEDFNGSQFSGVVFEDSGLDLDVPVVADVFKVEGQIKENELITLDSNSGEIFLGLKNHEEEVPVVKVDDKTSSKEVNEVISIPEQTEVKTTIETFIELPEKLELPTSLTNIDGGFSQDLANLRKFSEGLDTKPIIANINYAENELALNQKFTLIHKLRNQSNLRNIWISFSNIKNENDLSEVKKIMGGTRLRRSSTFKLYVNFSEVQNAFHLDEILAAEIDGLILDITKIIETLGIKTIKKALDSSSFLNFIDYAFLHAKKHKTKVMVRTSYDEDLVKFLMKQGIFGFIVDPKNLGEARKFISKHEIKRLSKPKKRGRKQKSF